MPDTPPITPPRTPEMRTQPLLDSPDSPKFFGPPNPYNPRTSKGREFIYFRDHLANPGSVDKWLQANMSLWPKSDPRSISTDLESERVECCVEMGYLQARPSLDSLDPFIDPTSSARYVLFLTVTVPDPTTLVWYRTSPRAILDHWEGSKEDIRAPDWCRSLSLGEILVFPHARLGVADFFARLALSEDNKAEGLSGDILTWAQGVSIIGQVSRHLLHGYRSHVTPARRSVPVNSKGRRLRASHLSEACASQLREFLTSLSPCKPTVGLGNDYDDLCSDLE